MTNPGNTQRPAVAAELLTQLTGKPSLAEGFLHFNLGFTDEGLLAPRLLELCRARVDALHQLPCQSSLDDATLQNIANGEFAEFTSAERLALDLAEQLTLDAHGVRDAQVAGVAAAIGEPATVTLLTAIAMHDANVRMQKVLVPLGNLREAGATPEDTTT